MTGSVSDVRQRVCDRVCKNRLFSFLCSPDLRSICQCLSALKWCAEWLQGSGQWAYRLRWRSNDPEETRASNYYPDWSHSFHRWREWWVIRMRESTMGKQVWVRQREWGGESGCVDVVWMLCGCSRKVKSRPGIHRHAHHTPQLCWIIKRFH